MTVGVNSNGGAGVLAVFGVGVGVSPDRVESTTGGSGPWAAASPGPIAETNRHTNTKIEIALANDSRSDLLYIRPSQGFADHDSTGGG